MTNYTPTTLGEKRTLARLARFNAKSDELEELEAKVTDQRYQLWYLRRAIIVDAVRAGVPQVRVAEMLGVSRQRIGQILKEEAPELMPRRASKAAEAAALAELEGWDLADDVDPVDVVIVDTRDDLHLP